jgi:hypothetical protein
MHLPNTIKNKNLARCFMSHGQNGEINRDKTESKLGSDDECEQDLHEEDSDDECGIYVPMTLSELIRCASVSRTEPFSEDVLRVALSNAVTLKLIIRNALASQPIPEHGLQLAFIILVMVTARGGVQLTVPQLNELLGAILYEISQDVVAEQQATTTPNFNH